MILETYNIKSEDVRVKVEIVGEYGKAFTYKVYFQEFEKATKALLEQIKNKLIVESNIAPEVLMSMDKIDILRKNLSKKCDEVLKKEFRGDIPPGTKKYIIDKIIREMLGLGKLDIFLADDNLEDIVVICSTEPLRVYHKKYGWLDTNVYLDSEEEIMNYSNIIGRWVGRDINLLKPMLDAHLPSGDRVNATLSPVSLKGNSITIRKFAREPWTVTDLINNKTCTSDIFALLWMAIQYEFTVLFSGGTASGKTTMMNVCMSFIPPKHSIISIEDTAELHLPSFLYWRPLLERLPNPEGLGAVKMLDLLVNSLRMRPDRIILGEIRRKQEAEVLFEAMHTGHSVYGTVHANTVKDTINRLIYPPINVPINLLSAVDLNVVMYRDRRNGIRRILQLGEFNISEKNQTLVAQPNIIYKWQPKTDKITKVNESKIILTGLGEHTGMSRIEVNKEIEEKKYILKWMVKKNIRNVQQVGRVIKDYYTNPESVLNLAKKNAKPKI